jgi:hypothetical protein
VFGLLAIELVSSAPAPLDEIKTVSQLSELDLKKLERGEIISNRGPLGDFGRGIYAESCYFVHAPMADVVRTLVHWDPSKHRSLEVMAFREYRWPVSGEEWEQLALSGTRREDRWLIDQTWQIISSSSGPGDLHVSEADVAALREPVRGGSKEPPLPERASQATNFWRKILKTRNDAVAAGGLDALPSYSANISARTEFNGLMSLAPRIAARFGLSSPSARFPPAPKAGEEIIPYWKAALVRGHTGFASGVILAKPGPQSGQIIDCTYYTSDTYYLAVSLKEVWPLENGTLVWQIDFVSAPFRSFTGGLDRVYAGNQMLKAAAQTIKTRRDELERR